MEEQGREGKGRGGGRKVDGIVAPSCMKYKLDWRSPMTGESPCFALLCTHRDSSCFLSFSTRQWIEFLSLSLCLLYFPSTNQKSRVDFYFLLSRRVMESLWCNPVFLCFRFLCARERIDRLFLLIVFIIYIYIMKR